MKHLNRTDPARTGPPPKPLSPKPDGAPAAATALPAEEGWEETLRLAITWRCDQRCAMCTLPHEDDGPSDDSLFATIEAAGTHGVQRLVLTGGEPLTHPRLAELIAAARDAGVPTIELQTNAVRLSRPGMAETLAEAGLSRAFVSLHAAHPATSDRVTGAPGTHAHSVEGVLRLLDAGVLTDINCVINRENLDDLDALVDLIADRFAPRPRFGRLHLHTMRADPDDPERWRPLVPPLSEVAPRLRRALERALTRGVAFTGPASAMGVPYCVLDGDERLLGRLRGAGTSRAHSAERRMFTEVSACEGCRLRGRCPGIRRGYVAIHGDDGVHTLSDAPPPEPSV